MGFEPCCLQKSFPEEALAERSTTWWLVKRLLALWRSQHVGQKLSLHWAQKWEATFLSPPAAQMSQPLLSPSSGRTSTCCSSSHSLVTLKSLGKDEMLESSGSGVLILQVGQEIPLDVPPPLPFQLVRHAWQNVCWHCKTLGSLNDSKHTMQRRKSSSISAEWFMDSAMVLPPLPPRPPKSFSVQILVRTSRSSSAAGPSPSAASTSATAAHIALLEAGAACHWLLLCVTPRPAASPRPALLTDSPGLAYFPACLSHCHSTASRFLRPPPATSNTSCVPDRPWSCHWGLLLL